MAAEPKLFTTVLEWIVLAEHVQALKLAVMLPDYFRSGDAIDDVKAVQQQHHELFLEVLAKKIHIPDRFAALKANFSCWRVRRPKYLGSGCLKIPCHTLE